MSKDTINQLQAELTAMTLEKQMRQMAETRNSELLRELEALAAEVAMLREALEVAIIGSCSCMTKTPDAAFHSEDCKYRIIVDALSLATNHAAILAQRDARTLMNAISRLRNHGGDGWWLDELYSMAAEFEAGKESKDA